MEKTNDIAKKAEQHLNVRKQESNKPEKKFIKKKEDKLGAIEDKADNRKLLDKRILNQAKTLKKASTLKRKRETE